MNARGRRLLFCLPILSWTAGGLSAEGVPARADFDRDVRPILSDHCYACHGPDEGQRKADLRLDVREGAFADLGGYRAIVPGKPGESELLRRVTHPDPEERMPPPDAGKALDAGEVRTLRRWIEAGAPWAEHWSRVSPARPPAPDTGNDPWPRSAIDRFVLARLRAERLEPAPEADARTLARRLHFDLTGLPPSPEDVDAFSESAAPDSYERAVDELLASVDFGERMAAHWLDLVRYADTNGIHGDNHRDVALYRDWVIDAFNRNLPFDRFTIAQLAGDLLPDGTTRDLVASGYNRLLMTTREGGAQPEEYRAKYAADRVRNASTVWLGATLGCAECHDHKFDPYTMKDFYSFAAFFADIEETAVGAQKPTPVPSPEERARIASLEAKIAVAEAALERSTPELEAAQAEWERSLASVENPWVTLRPREARSERGGNLAVLEDGTIVAPGEGPEKDSYEVVVHATLEGVTAFRLEVLADPRLPRGGPGRAPNGNFVLNEIDAELGGERLAWRRATATHSQKGYDVRRAADGDPSTGWAILEETGRDHLAVLETVEDIDLGDDTTLVFRLRQAYGGRHTIGRFRLSATRASRPVRAGAAIPAAVREALAVPPAERTDAGRETLAAHFRKTTPLLDPARRRLEELRKEKEAVEKSVATTLVTVSMKPRVTRILPRGNWLDDSGEVVEPAIPESLGRLSVDRSPDGEQRATRLDLARWLVSDENPVAARVVVNRLWKLFFGRAIARTPDDLGSQGARPTHPGLLDWLAVELVESGWDIKRLVRLIVTSSAYRQSSRASPELLRRDPYNRLLARQGRFRLDAEMVRDNALAVSGLLVRKVGGRSVKPYQPAGYWAHLNFPKRRWERDTGAELYRRGLYTYWCRTFLHPSLLAFDAPTREECAVARPRSNTPLQALVLLNDPTYVEAARVLAGRVIRAVAASGRARGAAAGEAEGPAVRGIRILYRRVLAREPRAEEIEVLRALYERHLTGYGEDAEAAKAVLGVGERPPAADLPARELAAWTSVARTVLNLHETITRY